MRRSLFAFPLAFLLLAGCSAAKNEEGTAAEAAFSSNQATLLDFEFDAWLETDFAWNERQTIQDQLLYTIGQLNWNDSVGRLDALELSNVTRTRLESGKTRIDYHAKLPVAWGRKTNLPTTYELRLPRDVSHAGLAAFTAKHKSSCVDWGAHDVDAGSMWYYYRPLKSGCGVTDDELVRSTAAAVVASENTTGKYPEYHKVWEDGRLEYVAIFGKYKEGGGKSDAGVSAFNKFVASMRTHLAAVGSAPVITPSADDRSGPDAVDVTFETTLPDGKQVKVVALLVESITNVWEGFAERYEGLTPTADIIAYNGHAGLGQNVRALARMGKWVPGQYQIFFMNGCDTFAYVDGSLAQTRAALNPDDPAGTKYLEFVTNAMPSFFHDMPSASRALLDGLLSYEAPKTYDEMFEAIDDSAVVLVTGEEDNTFEPGVPIGPVSP